MIFLQQLRLQLKFCHLLLLQLSLGLVVRWCHRLHLVHVDQNGEHCSQTLVLIDTFKKGWINSIILQLSSLLHS